MNGQMVGNKALKCAWGRHQPRHAQMTTLGILQMQSQMQSQVGFLGGQGMLGSMGPMLQMPAGMQMPSQLHIQGTPLVPSAQQAQQALHQQVLLNANLPLGGQLSSPLRTQQQMLAAHQQMDPNSSLYFNMYGNMYGPL